MKSIQIKNIGPIAALSLPVPADGGVVVLSGRNGSGKSTALDAISAAVSGKGKPPLKDLAARGEVTAGGITLTVGRAARRAGELEVSTLEGRLSVADLVDPGIVDPARADATRIKALVSLSRVGLSADDLCGFPPEMLDGLDLSDPVVAMAELKKRLDIGGREYEKLAKNEGARAAAMLAQAGNNSEPADTVAAMELVVASNREHDALLERKKAAESAKSRVAEAKERLASLPVIDIDELQHHATKTADAVNECKALAQKLKEQYNAAVERYKELSAQLDVIRERLNLAVETGNLKEQLEKVITESEIKEPADSEIAESQKRLESAQHVLESTQRAKLASDLRKQGVEKAAEADRLSAEAVALRRKAKQTDEILSEIVAEIPGCPFSVSDGRLVIDTARGPTMFSDLSRGERWRVALDIAVGAVGACGLLAIPQEAWEGLDPDNRGAIAAAAKAGNVLILTAECSDGPLSSALYAPAAGE